MRLVIVIFCIISAVSAICSLAQDPTQLTGNCFANVLQSYQLPLTPFTQLNPFLATDPDYLALEAQLLLGPQCDPSRDPGQVCALLPAIGSGLSRLPDGRFIGITDRGPNQDCGDLCALGPQYAEACGKTGGKGFPVPNFAPTLAIMRLEGEGESGQIIVDEYVFLKDLAGNPISGVSSSPLDDVPYGANCVGEPLKLDPNGLDTEEIHPIPGYNIYAIVDEYSPSIALLHSDGRIFGRYVPTSVGPYLENATYPINPILPDVLTNRRKNRGFENLAVSPSGDHLIAIVQSPMGTTSNPALADNLIIRAIKMRIRPNPVQDSNIPIVLEYDHMFIFEASPKEAYYTPGVRSRDMKYSAGYHVSETAMAVLERASKQVKLFYLDYENVTHIDDTPYFNNLDLEQQTAGVKSPIEFGVIPASKKKFFDSYEKAVGGTIGFGDSDKQEGFAFINDYTVVLIDDNDFGLENNVEVAASKVQLGRSITGNTVCQRPMHPTPPKMSDLLDPVPGANTISLEYVSTNVFANEPAAVVEILDISPDEKTLYSADNLNKAVNKFDGNDLKILVQRAFEGYQPNSVSVCHKDGRIAAGLQNLAGNLSPGEYVILIDEGNSFGVNKTIVAEGCFLPDAVKWSKDCRFLVGACEGEGADVPGAIFLYDDMEGMHYVLDFTPYNALISDLNKQMVRMLQTGTPEYDFEPEYVAFTGDSNYAFITLQENNAIAVVDCNEKNIAEIKPLFYKPYSIEGNGIDASDRDGMIRIQTYPRLWGMPLPDEMVNFQGKDGKDYFAFANEGDDLGDAVERIRVKDIEKDLGRTLHPDLLPFVGDELLGRLRISYPMGYNNETNVQEELYSFGARSFSIMALDGTIVFDSGDFIEQYHAIQYPKIFNSECFDEEDLDTTQEEMFDSRSDDKGPEPESVTLGYGDNGEIYLYLGNERTSVVMVFEVSDPKNVKFLTSVSLWPSDKAATLLFQTGTQGTCDPEGIVATKEMTFFGGSLSSSLSNYEIVLNASPEPTQAPGPSPIPTVDPTPDLVLCVNNGRSCPCGPATFSKCLIPTGDGMCRQETCEGYACLCPEYLNTGIYIEESSPICEITDITFYIASSSNEQNGRVPCVEAAGLGLNPPSM